MLLFIPVKPPVPCPYSDILSSLPVSPISADICRYDIGKAEGLSGTVSGKKKCHRYRIGADICHSDIGNIGEPAKSGTALLLDICRKAICRIIKYMLTS